MDAYDVFVVNLAKMVLAGIYPQTDSDSALVGTAALVGAVAGQLVCGALADSMGRRKVFLLTLSLVILGSLASAAVVDTAFCSIYTQLAVVRFILGFGVGGEYPLSATVSSEGSSDVSKRGRAVSSVFAMQGVGNLLASVVMLVLLRTNLQLDVVWRLAFAIGALPGLLTVYWRYKMEESKHFVKQQAASGAAGAPAAITAADRVAVGSVSSSSSSKRGGARQLSRGGARGVSTRANISAAASAAGTSVGGLELTSLASSSGAGAVASAAGGGMLGGIGIALHAKDSSEQTAELEDGEEEEEAAAADEERQGLVSAAAAANARLQASSGMPAEDDEEIALFTLTDAAATDAAATSSSTSSRSGGAAAAAPPRGALQQLWQRIFLCLPLSMRGTLQLCWAFRWTLLGTAGSWFLLDIAFYSHSLFNGAVLDAIGIGKETSSAAADAAGGSTVPGEGTARLLHSLAGPAVMLSGKQLLGQQGLQWMSNLLGTGSSSIASAVSVSARALSSTAEAALSNPAAFRATLSAEAAGSSVLALMALPGYILAVLFIDRIGRRRLQLLGFAAMAALYAVLGVWAADLTNGQAVSGRGTVEGGREGRIWMLAVCAPFASLLSFPLPSLHSTLSTLPPVLSPSHPFPSAEQLPLHCHLRPHLLLQQLRPQHDHICHPC